MYGVTGLLSRNFFAHKSLNSNCSFFPNSFNTVTFLPFLGNLWKLKRLSRDALEEHCGTEQYSFETDGRFSGNSIL